MTIYTQGTRVRTARYLEEYESTLPDVLATTSAESLLFSPTSSIARSMDQSVAELEPTYPGGTTRTVGGKGGGVVAPVSPIIPAEEARKRITEDGLDLTVPDEGIREGALRLLIERKIAERRRQDVLNRAPRGFVPGALRVTTALATTMLDPLNVASAFIPVVGEMRYLGMLSKAAGPLARAGVRARVGAIEGAAGAAIVEPLIYFQAQREQADYDLGDSLINIAFGTAIGGGLHVGAGWVGDLANPGKWQTAKPTGTLPRILDQMAPETREAALRTAVAQAAEGKSIEVASLLDAFRPTATGRIAEVEGQISRMQQNNLGGRFNAEIKAAEAEIAPFRQLIEMQRALTGMQQNNLGGRFTSQIAETQKAIDDLIGDIVVRPEQVRAEAERVATLENARRMLAIHKATLDRILREERPEGGVRVREAKGKGDLGEIGARIGRREIRARIGAAERDVAAARREVRELEAERGMGPLEIAREEILRRIGAADPRPADPIAAVKDAAERQEKPEASRLADFPAADDGAAKLADAPKTEDLETAEADLADVDAALQTTAAALGAEEIVARELAPFDDLVKTADAYGAAVRAAALCQLRRG